MSNDDRIAVIGGGIIGVTTAALLQLNGHPTVLYALAHPSDYTNSPPPSFASLHAAASILPHSVAFPHSTRWTAASQEYFLALATTGAASVRTQRHYEIFEADNATPPAYSDAVRNFELLDEAGLRARSAPVRPDAGAVTGWCFSAFFCEAPGYLRFLYDLFQVAGGAVVGRPQLPEPPALAGYLARDHTLAVLCAGQASGKLVNELLGSGEYDDRPLGAEFEPAADPAAAKFIRGHYLKLNTGEPLLDFDDSPFSYNYTPVPAVYPRSDGSAADVYCYPRAVGWLLGGSRQVGRLDETGAWLGEVSACEEIEIPGEAGVVSLPSPILNLNRELLAATRATRVDLDSVRRRAPSGMAAAIGLRFVRDDPRGNVRLGVSRVAGPSREHLIIHNYGHGGAGYTLSWGCALDVLAFVRRVVGPPPRPADPANRHAEIKAVTDRLLPGPVAPLGRGT